MALFYTKDCSTGLTFISVGLLCTLALSTNLFLSQEAFATEGQPLEIIAQQTSGNTKPSPKATDSTSSNEIQKKIDEFNKQLKEFKENKIANLRGINQGFSITFIVVGIMATLIGTATGAVESQNPNVKKWTNLAIIGFGSVAVAAQSLNSAFPVTKRAGTYAEIESEITILEFKIKDVTNDSQMNEIKNEFYKLIKKSGELESGSST